MDAVFVVLFENYGDQGVDFCGVFKTRELAQEYINKRESDPHDRQYFEILEEEVQG